MPDYSLTGLALLARNRGIVSVEPVSARGREMPLLQTAASVERPEHFPLRRPSV